MIKKLQNRMMLMVSAILLVITIGIILSINIMNWGNITSQAKEALFTLAQNSGLRPSLRKSQGEDPPEKPGENETDSLKKPGESETDSHKAPGNNRSIPGGMKRRLGQPLEADNALASLSNYYVATLSSENTVISWQSDRSDLYTDEQVRDMVAVSLDTGKSFGRIGTQFFMKTKTDGKNLVIVLDERLEILSARRVLTLTAVIAGIACLVLCIGAFFLIRRMVRPVQDAFDRQRQFVWDASHELKTPLAVIGSNAQVLAGEIGENEYLEYILSEVNRSDALLKDLLTLARMDRGKIGLEPKDVDLSMAVMAVALPFESTVFEAGKRLELSVPEEIHCKGDSAMLQQLTMILLSNALKYSARNGWIKVSLEVKGKECLLQVSNDGPGIGPQDKKRIFDRFYRADTAHNRETEGFGLGLAIAGNIVELHHGRIEVSSVENEETVFRVFLRR